MKTHFTLNVPTPCHEDWNNFTPTQKGKFCRACQKEVIDFTRWADDEIKDYFKNNRSNSTCGRFNHQQLKTYQAEKPTSSHSTYAAFIAFLMLLVTEPAEAQINLRQEKQEQVDELKKEITQKVLIPITVSGIVIYDSDSTALPGVNVVRKNTSEGTVTDGEGRFQLTINSLLDRDSLEFSFIGFKTVTIPIPQEQDLANLKIVMTNDEFVLVGIVGGAVAVRWYSPRNWWWKLKGLFRR